MGSGRWDADDWKAYKTTTRMDSKKVDDIYNKALDILLDPKDVRARESRDSEDNPNSNAIIIALDVTGSMSSVLDDMARNGLKTLVTEIYDRKPVSDPHIMCMGVGDVEAGDRAPLQVTQFEADIRIAEQLAKIYLEMGGGGNCHESYHLPWYFAAMHTSIDCFEKRGKKGYLFTVGDEQPPRELLAKHIEKVLGYLPQADLTTNDILTMVSRSYHVFHLMVAQGSHFKYHRDTTVKEWTEILGQRALVLDDYTKLAEVVVSAIQVNEGIDVDTVVKSWDGSTSLTVRTAVKDIVPHVASEGIVVL